MSQRNKKKIGKKIALYTGLFFLLGILLATGALLLSMRPPEGNVTLNRSGRVDNGLETFNENKAAVPQSPPSEKQKQIYTFLVAGKDKVSDNTDTIMLVKLDITDKKINILHIPRDTMLDTNRKAKKVNASYMLGGIEQFEQDVATLTGFYVNRYVIFDIKGVEKIIDAIGGVYFDVPRNMHYEDPTQNLSIHISKGYQHLNGENAVKLARYRSGYRDGDIGRIGVQQELLKALAAQALKPENFLKLPELVQLISENIETDIDLGNMLWLANQVKDFPLDSIETFLLPGVASMVDGLSYWLPYKNELLDLINNEFNPLSEPITENDISIPIYPENKGK